MWLNLKTEFSFGAVYGKVEDIISKAKEEGWKTLGIADLNNTYGHVKFSKECIKNKIKPVFGVRLNVVPNLQLKEKRQDCETMSFIAITNKGLQQLYELTKLATEQFYYKPIIDYHQVNKLKSKDVAIIAQYSPKMDLLHRHVFIQLSPNIPYAIYNLPDIDYIAGIDNWYINEDQKQTYELFAEERKLERKTTPMHILTKKEYISFFGDKSVTKKALKNLKNLTKLINVELKKAPMVEVKNKLNIKEVCKQNAKKKGIDLKDSIVKERLKRELKLIKEKQYEDYFCIVSDLINYSKQHMLVGHARGSSAGSLVCYLMGITEINPLEYGLLFERFIDINRTDLPDIDIDFQDDKRDLALQYLINTYGIDKVSNIGTVSRLKPKSAITRVGKALNLLPWDYEELKDSVDDEVDRKGMVIHDCFTNNEVGQKFIKDFPAFKSVVDIENHASHTGIHAAGIIVSSKPITKYCGIDARDNKNIAMIDLKDAEELGLLKIDCLGLRTLTIISEVCDMVEIPYKDVYTLPLNDEKTYSIFNDKRLTGIFQFEGESIKKLAEKMPIENINDISILTSIGRPGPMIAGASERFVQCRSGKREVKYISEHKNVKEQLEETLGEIIYQEQVMFICRNYAKMPWPKVIEIRKAIGKSLGDEQLSSYKEEFIQGALNNNASIDDAENVWKAIKNFGQYGFNKSHAVSYAMITYICAYLKANYPLEFAVASLNHTKGNKEALRLLRDLKENEGIEYIPFLHEESKEKWTIFDGKLLAGLSSLNGIADKKAKSILNKIQKKTPLTDSEENMLSVDNSPFQFLYPAKQIYGDYYKNPKKHGIGTTQILPIKKIKTEGEYCCLGMLIDKTVKDANDLNAIKLRGYKVESENTTCCSFSIEDDTGIMKCSINYKDFVSIGETIVNDCQNDKDWFLIFGKYSDKFNMMFVKNIRKITNETPK